MGVPNRMKFLAIALLCAAFSCSFTADADAGIFRNRPARRGMLWSPGILLPMITQNMGGPRMVWRGDWVPAHMVK